MFLRFTFRTGPANTVIAKIAAASVAAYALSPIDLIPDFVPMLGYLMTS